MWRQLFVICLLITLSGFWSVAQASIEREFEDQERFSSLRHPQDETKRENIDVQSPQKDIAEGDGEINKDVAEPGSEAAEPPAVADGETGDKTDMPKTTNAHPTPAHLQINHHKQKTADITKFGGSDMIFIVVVAACSVAGLVGIIMAGVCWYKLNRSAKAASDVEYPAYGVTGPNKERIPSPGDRKLAQSAQMYHYQHQKQQMIAMEKANGEMKHDASDEESEEENEEGDYTVYECPGLAPTGEMEVKNPLFSDETPVTPSAGDEADKDEGN